MVIWVEITYFNTVSEETFLSQERIFSAGTNFLALLLEGIIVNCDITEVLLGGCKTVILTSTELSLHPQSHWLKPESLLIRFGLSTYSSYTFTRSFYYSFRWYVKLRLSRRIIRRKSHRQKLLSLRSLQQVALIWPLVFPHLTNQEVRTNYFK